MASLKDAQQLTKGLEDLVGRLRAELQNGDFEKLVSISDEISERADGLAETFSTVNETLMERIQQVRSGTTGDSRGSSSKAQSKSGARGS